jgi:hypothetical protein
MAPGSNGSGGGGLSSLSPLTGFLLGAVGLLVALLGALATSNGGTGRIELNERTWLLSGTIAVLFAIVFAACAAVLLGAVTTRPVLAGLLIAAGALCLVAGLSVVTYAAVTHVAGRPGISATLKWDKDLGVLLDGEVTVNDIPSNQHLEMRVVSFSGGAGGAKPTSIYGASFGPNSSGDVAHSFEVPVPRASSEVLVQAWTGSPGPCLDRAIPANPTPTSSDVKHNIGCLRLRLQRR